MEYPRQKIKEILINQWGYPLKQADGVIKKIFKMESSILEAFYSWLKTEELPDEPNFHGCTPRLLYDTYPLKPPAAFMLLDWIRREPQSALNALREEHGRLPLTKNQD